MYRNVNDGYALFDDVAVSIYSPPSIAGGDTVDAISAHDGSHISRTGHHNDCFLASDTDYGTYTAPYSWPNMTICTKRQSIRQWVARRVL